MKTNEQSLGHANSFDLSSIMAEYQWPFSDSESESEDFGGFTAEELAGIRRPVEDDDDISVESYYSSSKDESEESSSSDDNDRPIRAPAVQLPNNWTDQLSESVIEDFENIPGPNTVLTINKKEIDFFFSYCLQKTYMS